MNENKKVLFIINKFSGTGYSAALEGRIIERCAQAGFECRIEFTQARGHATELAQDAALQKDYHRVFAVGGDGTVNEVAKGLIHSSTVMGILPKGSGNGLARHLGVPMNFEKSLNLIHSDNIVNMDTFTINDQLSVNVSGIGFDGHIAFLFGKNGKRGLMGYVKLVAREFKTYQEFEIDLEMDGHPFTKKAFIVAIANSSQFGNNARVAPHASVCDEWIDISFIRKIPLPQAIGFAYKMFTGKLYDSSFVEMAKAKNLIIRSARPIPFHIDGEPFEARQEFKVAIMPHSLKMVVPSSAKL